MGREFGKTLLETLLEEPRPVLDRPRHKPCKDKVEGCRETPLLFDVVDKEGCVRGDTISTVSAPFWLCNTLT